MYIWLLPSGIYNICIPNGSPEPRETSLMNMSPLSTLVLASRFYLSAILLSISLNVAAADIVPIVDLGYAQYQGYWNATSNITSFLGVRYAAPPTGALRFSAPQAPSPTPGVQQATTDPNYCYQTEGVYGASPTNPYFINGKKRDSTDANVANSEDCLFLNVFTPGTSLNTSLPVVVWIHGGGYVQGGAQSNRYNGADLVADSLGNVVSVIIQYRLGVFGFLPGNAVYQNGSINAGLLDQTFALEWVQKNIQNFGGDASKVTIWGESAGAGSVLQHVVANGGNTQPPLFRAAITSSTFVPSQFYFNDTIPEELYDDVVTQANCTIASDSLSCLRSLDSATMATVNSQVSGSGFYGTYRFVPVVDGSLIVESPTATLQDGRHNAGVLLSVTNENEGNNFVNQSNSNLTNYVTNLFPLLSLHEIGKAVELYSSIPDTTVAEQCNLVMGESIFVCPTYLLLHAFGDAAYKGEFAVPPATHGDDVAYYFGSKNKVVEGAFTEAFSQSYASMIIYLNPNDKLNKTNPVPVWPIWSRDQTEMLFNETSSGSPNIYTLNTNSTMLERCSFWQGLHERIGQ